MAVNKSQLAPPTQEFLAEVRERARRYGWSGDYLEVIDFIKWLYDAAGVSAPDLEPYPICKTCDRVKPDCIC